jgi:predicted RNA-binding Zn-ribbon protein involved in translation (DUF1610 family)
MQSPHRSTPRGSSARPLELSLACSKCGSANIVKMKRNSFERTPGYTCQSCGVKLRGASSTRTLYTYIYVGLAWLVVDRLFLATSIFAPTIGLAVGSMAALYGFSRLRRPLVTSLQQRS